MSFSNYQLNQRISYLQSEINNIIAGLGNYVPINGNSNVNDTKTFTGTAVFNNIIDGSINGNSATSTTSSTTLSAPDSSLSSNVPLKNGTNIFSSNNTFNNLITGSISGNSSTSTQVNINSLISPYTQNTHNILMTDNIASGAGNAEIFDISNNSTKYLQFVSGPGSGSILKCYSFEGTGFTVDGGSTRLNTGALFSLLDISNSYISNIQQSGLNLTITNPPTGAIKILTQGTGILPSANSDSGISISWNISNGGGESDFLNYQGVGSSGGFNFYNVSSSTTSTKIATITKTQPPTTDNSNNLATTAWVKSLTNSLISPKFTITNTSPITSTPFTTLLNSITLTGLTNNGIFFLNNGLPNLYNYLTIRLNYTINDNLNTSIVNFTTTLMLFPQRISGNVLNSQTFGFGAVPQTVYNLNNNLNNNTTFGYTNITYASNGRQYYSTSPNGGVISGVSTGLDTLYLNGQYAAGGIAKFGFNLKPWSQTTIPYGASTTAFLTMSLEVLYNPDPSVIISFSNS